MGVDRERRFRELTDLWNAGEMGAFFAGFDPDVEFSPDERWPEPGPYRGREAVERFMLEWRGPWERVDFLIDELIERAGWVVARARWLVRGAASGAEVPVAFTLCVRFNEAGLVCDMRGFFEHADALAHIEGARGDS